jgi:very-long-chain (3R)-3-hydroxyacyl-CoA dehydratase
MGLKDLYLLAYNGGMVAGWGAIFYKVVAHLAGGGQPSTAYPLVQQLLMVFQTGALLEILHAMTKLVRSPVATTVMQVFSRIVVLWGGLELGSKDVTQSYWATQMILSWALVEVIRYSFYAINIVSTTPKWLTWIRYSAFLVLYPTGITGELGCLYTALPFLKETAKWSIAMPNAYNFSFSYYSFVWFLLAVVYPPGSYIMFTHMLGQRSKILAKLKTA